MWDKEQLLEPKINASIGFGLYTPRNSDKSFILYNRPDNSMMNQELGVKSLNLNDRSLGNFSYISSGRLYFGGDIKGDQEGSELLVAYGASRVKTSEAPPANSSMYDIFLSYSTNNASTWSQELGSKGDAVIGRIMPVIVPIEELGQIFFFNLNLLPTNHSAIVVKKLTGSNLLSGIPNENVIYDSKDTIVSYSAAYTYNENKLMLHLVLANNRSIIMYTNSTDGITWTIPIEIGRCTNQSTSFPFLSLASDTIISKAGLFLAFIGPDEKAHFRMSDDAGKTWAIDEILTTNKTDSVNIALCGNQTRHASFLLTSEQGKFKMHVITESAKVQLNQKAPFENMLVGSPFMQCIRKNEEYHIQVLATSYEKIFGYIATGKLI